MVYFSLAWFNNKIEILTELLNVRPFLCEKNPYMYVYIHSNPLLSKGSLIVEFAYSLCGGNYVFLLTWIPTLTVLFLPEDLSSHIVICLFILVLHLPFHRHGSKSSAKQWWCSQAIERDWYCDDTKNPWRWASTLTTFVLFVWVSWGHPCTYKALRCALFSFIFLVDR